jgi:DNA-binding NtrC family response regulator
MRKRGKVFLLDDDELIVGMLGRVLKKEGYEVRTETSAKDAVEKIASWSPDVLMLDITLPERNGIDILRELKGRSPEIEIVMLTADDTAETAIKAMKLGASDYQTKPFNIEEVKIVIDNLVEKERLKQEVDYLRKSCVMYEEQDLIGNSPAIKELKAKAEKIARARVPTVLVTGESGTGKELVARYMHRVTHPAAADGSEGRLYAPFVAVNCTALPESLLESELFGYEKGAFTDAKTDKKGVFEVAGSGSILLDEIGDMKPSLQTKLLRILEERSYRRLGGRENLPVNATVIATTNRDLSEAVEAGEFRMDLYYRLTAFSLHIPSLRERKEDIPLLANYFLSLFASRYNKKSLQGFSPEAERLLTAYDWPGNVRELKNIIERVVVLESGDLVLPDHLPAEMYSEQAGPRERKKENGFVLPEEGLSLETLEKDLIRQALDRANNNKTVAAKLLNVSYDSLRYQIKKHGLK